MQTEKIYCTLLKILRWIQQTFLAAVISTIWRFIRAPNVEKISQDFMSTATATTKVGSTECSIFNNV